MPKKIIQGAQPYFGDSIPGILRAVEEILVSGQLAHGARLDAFEKAFAEYTGTTYALGVSSGGTALELALKALDVRGKEVIVPTDTFVASANSVLLAGGTPVFADIKRDTLCLDPEDVAKRIGPKTAGIMLVHMFGLVPSDVQQLQELCRKHKLFLIEDAAHAHGANYRGVNAGALGDIACFSFYATKVITCGEGGVITTSREDLRNKILQLRNHGRSLTQPVYEIPSNNYRLTEIQACIAHEQLKGLEDNVIRRNEIANLYRKHLSSVSGIEVLPASQGGRHAYWRFPIYMAQKQSRAELQSRLDEKYGIRVTWMYEPLCHLQPVFSALGQPEGSLPQAEWCMEHLICLPCYPGISDVEVEFISTAVREEIAAIAKAAPDLAPGAL